MMPFSGHESRGTGLRRLITSRTLQTWYTPLSDVHPGPLVSLLSLGSRLYECGLKYDQRRALLRKRSLPAFVISIGNLVAGGTGKTPFTLWLSRYFREKGRQHAILSRGYGRSSGEAGRVPIEGETLSLAKRFGDEPVLMAKKSCPIPVHVGRDRWTSGMRAMESTGADLFILDDAFQHLSLERDMDIVLLDSGNPFGNGELLPLGPLREPVRHLERADAIILTRADNPEILENTRRQIEGLFPQKPLFACRHRLRGLRSGLSGDRVSFSALGNRPAVAFAGIARPEAFFQSLRESGVFLSQCLGFPDHHWYGKSDISLLMQSVRENHASFLITTEKDFVRLPALLQDITLTVELDLDFGSDYDALCSYLDSNLPLWNYVGAVEPGSSSGL
ncbi:MAG: tetraacyldisaccharide 4'-kinase [Syntrophobacteraceae bacterium]